MTDPGLVLPNHLVHVGIDEWRPFEGQWLMPSLSIVKYVGPGIKVSYKVLQVCYQTF